MFKTWDTHGKPLQPYAFYTSGNDESEVDVEGKTRLVIVYIFYNSQSVTRNYLFCERMGPTVLTR